MSFTHQGSRRRVDHFWTCWLRCQVELGVQACSSEESWPGVQHSPGVREASPREAWKKEKGRTSKRRPSSLSCLTSVFSPFALNPSILEATERWQNMSPLPTICHIGIRNFLSSRHLKKQQMQEGPPNRSISA